MFNKVLLIYSEKLSKKHLASVEKAKEILMQSKCNARIIRANEMKPVFFDDIELVITLGGDGTFIRAASFLKEQLILGINSEPETSEGAFLEMIDNELHLLNEIINGKYELKKLPRIQVKKNGILLNEKVLNEVYFGTESQFHVSRYIIKFKEQEEEQRSSGVLIVTSHGSNAWFKSAGGIPFTDDEKLAFLIREPYTGKKVFKPKILHGFIHRNEKIELISKRHEGTIVALDANKVYPISFNDEIEVSFSDEFLNVAKVKK